MQRTRDWRRSQYKRHYSKKLNRVISGGRHGYWKANRHQLEKAWRWFRFERRHFERLDGYNEVDYNRLKWKLDTKRMIDEQRD